uniref:Uncharacterized protein n=1 Tax=Cacopsylla melanoneura TaxID=428564 RepID=A0A8D8LGS0_9HEMI
MDNSTQILIHLVFTYKTINSSYSPSITFIILSSNHLTNITTLHVLTSPLCSTLIHLCSFSKSRPYLCSLSTDIPLMLPSSFPSSAFHVSHSYSSLKICPSSSISLHLFLLFSRSSLLFVLSHYSFLLPISLNLDNHPMNHIAIPSKQKVNCQKLT